MIAKSTKTKYRNQRREASVLLEALRRALPDGVGEGENNGWPTCAALNERAGIAALAQEAAWVARFKRGSAARAVEASQCSADVVAALGYNTTARVLELAGLL